MRFFSVDLSGRGTLGIRFEHKPDDPRLMVVAVREQGQVHQWNMRCTTTNPADAVIVGDYVVQVNDFHGSDVDMVAELCRYVASTSGELFMVMQRCGGLPPAWQPGLAWERKTEAIAEPSSSSSA